MLRLLAFVLGLLALVVFVPMLVLSQSAHEELVNRVSKWLDPRWIGRIQTAGPGVLAGLALLITALRSGGGTSKDDD